MTWAEWLLLVPTACYLGAALGYALEHRWGMAITFASYALANCGLIWAGVAGRT